jgi:hypothetical protein
MINQGSDVPDNTISIFIDPEYNISFKDLSEFIKKPSKKRSWFTPHFYRCLPLSIANQYGFILTLPFDLEMTWDGSESPNAVKIITSNHTEKRYFFNATSQFGSGIVTITTPFFIKTPKNVNIMTINPPNYILPNITVMSGVVETDNIRGHFTFNIKIQIPGITTTLRKGMPISGIIPIPRYFSDGFSLKDASEIFTAEEINEEFQASKDHKVLRQKTNTDANLKNEYHPDRLYLRGMDIYGNKFPDHQI